MPIGVNFIRLTPEFTTTNQRQLVGTLGCKVSAEIFFYVSTYAKGLTDEPIIFRDPAFLQTTIMTDESGSGKFKDFHAGDTFTVVSTGANNGVSGNILEKISDNSVRTDIVFSFENDEDCTVFLTTQPKGFTYFWNLVGNNEAVDFFSKIGGEIKKYTLEHSLSISSNEQMIKNGFQSAYNEENVNLEYTGVSGSYEYFFVVRHSFYIGPLFVPSLYTDLIANVPPVWFVNDECLRHVFRIEARPSNNDPNRVQFIEFDDELGDTGWLNENNNGKPDYYNVDSVTFERVSDSVTLDTIQLSDTELTEITIRITNTTTSPFVNGANVVLSIVKTPELDSEVSNNTKSIDKNFLFDRQIIEVGGPIVNGIKFGTDYQFLTTMSAVLISPDEIEVVCRVDMGTEVYSNLNDSNTQRYMLLATVADPNLDTNQTDMVTKLVALQDFYTDLGIDNLITFTTGFLEHPYDDLIDVKPQLDSFINDEIVIYTQAVIDVSQAPDTVNINGAVLQVIAINDTTGESFVLKEFVVSFASAPIVNGLQFVSIVQDNGLKIDDGQIFSDIKIIRRTDLDAPPLYTYDVYFAFVNRWEYWKALNGVNTDFFEVNEPNNGLNHLWSRYDDIGDWKINHRVRFNVSVGSESGSVINDTEYGIYFYEENPDWEQSIELENEAGDPYPSISGFEKTKVRAIFTWVGAGTAPAIGEVDIELWLEPEEQGGELVATNLTSARERTQFSQFLSLDNSNKVIVTEPAAGTFYGEAWIDNNKLQDFARFTITSRIYDKRLLIIGGKEVSGGPIGDYKETSEGSGIKQISS